jgi:hypothetical protein
MIKGLFQSVELGEHEENRGHMRRMGDRTLEGNVHSHKDARNGKGDANLIV